ncbi:MAG: flagellar biosynthesis anti-sigma factor FlgM [Hydrogenibacillus sp.]|nr:flagellar biosynthesis anti-sigma factor FlgM [Hydrogenibacillus sp.]
MKIDPTRGAAGAYLRPPKAPQGRDGVDRPRSSGDRVEISAEARALFGQEERTAPVAGHPYARRIGEAGRTETAAAPEGGDPSLARAKRLAELKRSVAEGTYRVDSKAVADAILRYLDGRGRV